MDRWIEHPNQSARTLVVRTRNKELRGRTLFAQFRLAFLHTRNNHIAHRSIRQPIQSRAKPIGLDDEQTLRTAVVGTIEHGAHGQTERNAEFRPSTGSTYSKSEQIARLIQREEDEEEVSAPAAGILD